MLLKDEILFTEDECKSILDNVNEWSDTIISVRLDSKFDENGGVMKSNNVVWNDENNWIKDRIVNWVNNIDGLNEINKNNLSAYFRKYVVGDYFIKHNDHVNEGPKRIYTIGLMIHSSNDLVGGDLKFYLKNEIIKMDFKVGKVYVFDSSIPHSVDLIEIGERVTLMFFIGEYDINLKIKTLL